MTRYLIDTTPLSGYLQGRPAAVALINELADSGQLTTSIVNYGEVEEYIKGMHDYAERHARLLEILTLIRPRHLNLGTMERYAEIRRSLRRPHGPGLIGDIDTLIAATAIELNLVLVTADSDFERVPGINLRMVNLREPAR